MNVVPVQRNPEGKRSDIAALADITNIPALYVTV
jgi:hypothetical protein